MANKYLHIVQWNVNGYISHLEMLQLLIADENPSVIALQKTHFKNLKSSCPKNFCGYY